MHKSVQNIEFTPMYLFADMHKSVQQSHALTKTDIRLYRNAAVILILLLILFNSF